MKVLAINGSPHSIGGTYNAIKLVADELISQGIDVEIINIDNKPIQGCTGCGGCYKTGECVYNDIVNECIEKSKSVDGIILGSPVYYAGISGTMKCFLDRFFYAGKHLSYKVGASVVSVRREGGASTFHQLNNYFELAGVIIAPSNYWCVLHGKTPEEILQDEEGMDIMKNLGKNMSWLMKSLEISKLTLPAPERVNRRITNFIR